MRVRTSLVAMTLAVLAVLAVAGTSGPAAAATGQPVGPDVSRWQHPSGAKIDWNRVHAAGSAFAIVKATESDTYTNPYYAADVRDARAAKLVVGSYAFARPALPISTATSQALHYAAAIGNVRTAGTLPPVLDLEVSGGLSSRDLITWTQQYLETLRAATGRTPVVYSAPYFWSSAMAGTTAFGRYRLWQASYSSTAPAPLPGWTSWNLWQYTSTAATPGIRGASDKSRFNGTAAQLAAFADGRPATGWRIFAPAAPRRAAAVADDHRAVVRWQPSDDGGQLPSRYTVTAAPGGAQVVVPGTATSVTVPSLRSGTSYTFRVTATNSAGSSPSSVATSAVVPGQVPATPARPSARSTPGRVALSWPAAGGRPSRYGVYRCSPAPCTPQVQLASVTSTSYVDRAVINGRSYAYAISAGNGFGSSKVGPAVRAAPVGPPTAVTSVSASATANTATLTWKPPLSDGGAALTGFTVTADGTAAVLAASARSFTVSHLAAGTSHLFTVAAVNARGTGLVVRVTATTTGAAGSATAATATTTQLVLRKAVRTDQPLLVAIKVVRSGTSTGVPGVPVTLKLLPVAGKVPVALHVTTGTGGLATVTLHPIVNTFLRATAGATALTKASTVAAAFAVTPAVSASLSTTSAHRGQAVTLAGRTDKLFAGERVYRQGYYSGAWHNWTSTRVDATGHYRFIFTPRVATIDTYRVVLPASRLHTTGISTARQLRVS